MSRRSVSDTDLSGVRHRLASGNFFKSLLLLDFLIDSFETRYTYFLGQSPNFVLFRILKFGFSDFCYEFYKIFIEIATAPTISNGFLWNYVHLLSRSVFTSSSFEIFEICIFYLLVNFHSIFIQIATAPTIFNGFLWNEVQKLGTGWVILKLFVDSECFI